MLPTTTTFNYTEEAFLLSSLQEVVKVWARGSGQASFDLQVTNGVADLKLGFRLGHPADLHSEPAAPPPPHLNPQQVHHPYQDHFRPHRRQKGPKRRERDRKRAEMYQHRHHPQKATPAAVILPITGKLLPVKKLPPPPQIPPLPEGSQAAGPAVSSPPQPFQAVTPPAAPNFPAAVRPTKYASAVSPNYVDSNLAKKKLFPPDAPPPDPHQVPPSTSRMKSYQKKEDDLLSKLFSI